MGRLGKIAEAVRPAAWQWAQEARTLHRAHGVSYRQYPAARAARLHLVPEHIDLRGGLIVDLGANVGDWTANTCAALPGADVLAVEPVPQLRERLKARMRSLPNVCVDGRAVDSQTGSATFYLTQGDVFGSLLEPHPAFAEVYGNAMRVTGEVTVPVATLDDILAGRDVSLLKMDVQGAELRVIGGGEQALRRTRSVLIEVNFAPHYENGSTVSTVHEALTAYGFVLWSWVPQPARGPDGRILWTDMCYARPPN